MSTAEERTEEQEPRSRAAGGIVLVAVAAIVAGVLAKLAPEVGVLAVWVVGAAVVWWSARRRQDRQPLPSPTAHPSPENELPGHGPVTVTRREGMSIYVRDDGDNPARTHVHVVHDQTHA